MVTIPLRPDLLDNRLEPASVAPRTSGGAVKSRPPYLPDAGLDDAAALSVMLGQPLLLSGRPGVGKTGAAYYIADKLGLVVPTRLTVNSSTAGRDLLYRFDALARFYDASLAGRRGTGPADTAGRDPGTGLLAERRFLRLEALGRAIAQAAGGNALVYDASTGKPVTAGERIAAITGKDPGPNPSLRVRDLFPAGISWLSDDPVPTLVLIDEIDKAQREAANDLLESFEAMRFTIEELGIAIAADQGEVTDGVRLRARPVVVVTTNSEQNLPDAFIRRCVFHHIPPPSKETLKAIVMEQLAAADKIGSRVAMDVANVAVDVAVAVAARVRGKIPGTAEYIALARAIAKLKIVDSFKPQNREANRAAIRSVLGTLVKTVDDLKIAEDTVMSMP